MVNGYLNICILVLWFESLYIAEKIIGTWQSPLFHKNVFLTKFEQKGSKLASKFFGGIFKKKSLVFIGNNLK